MSEMTDLTLTIQNFIVHWGEMGERWGINRTVAQIQALLYVSPEPLNAEQISQTLSVARSTVSVGLRELQYWGIINIVHKLGDRTDYFELIGDVWEMFRKIADRRIQNELDPTILILREAINQLETDSDDKHSHEKLQELLEVLDTASDIYKEVQKIPTKTIIRIAKMSDVVSRIIRLPQEK
jgi:DNA-binding transcriptional regulator GbsR (MarR family)